ncbi:la protein -like [Asbolus verrucosus]|uniref:La protein-like n=1 Tax=Asbolus verrucosus TaxID=1661398 RepID=A0A482VA68_ASBVE|nr:la protein -like [Asbolus verrucosus]
MASELENKIIRQIEYYFGDINLPRDKFMQEKLKEDDGWITLEVLLTFKRLAALSEDPEVIAAAVEKAENGLVEVSEDRKKIRRNPDLPLPELNDARKKELMERTAYAKGFPVDETLNDIINFLEPHGPIDSCHRRSTKDRKFKGSCFIIFKDKETCKKFIEQESFKYKDTELIRKWQSDYFAEKKKEYEEKVKSKKDKKQAKLEEKCKQLEYPKGAAIHFSGIPEGKSLTREEIKEKIKEIDESVTVAYVDFNKGDVEGHLRLSAENAAVEFLKKLTDGELEVNEVKLKLRALEGAEQEEYLKKTAEAVTKMREKAKQGKNSRKRKGGHFSNGREAKAKKT